MTILPHNKPSFGIEEEMAAVRVIRSGWVAQGREVDNFEKEFCEFLGLPDNNAVALSSGTAALFLALWVLNAKDKKIAFPVYACSALRNAVGLMGAEEILIDTAASSPNIDLDKLGQSSAHIAIIPHMFGIPVDFSCINGIDIIEDCAHAMGAMVNGVNVGLSGRAAIYSFYATKLITSGGHGGMFVSKDRALVDAVRDYREFDRRRDSKKRFNFQMTDLQAAIGREQLRKLPSFLMRRAQIFEQYRAGGVRLLGSEKSGENHKPVRYRAIALTELPQNMIASLEEAGIKAIIPIEDWELLGKPEAFFCAAKLTRETVSLPVYPSLSDNDVQRIISIVIRQ